MNALHFGAGKIGRGFIGAILSQAGYNVTFADVNSSVVSALNSLNTYSLHILDSDASIERVCGVRAVLSDSAVDEIIAADLITTAVSMNLLPTVAPIVAQGLVCRRNAGVVAPLDIVCCENGIRATSYFKQLVFEHLDNQMRCWAEQNVGFADGCVDRIVPVVTLENSLDVAVERFYEWCVERISLKGGLREIEQVHFVEDIDACVYRKLFTLNTAHCATAYLGALRGYEYIHDAIADKWVQSIVRGVMGECSQMLIAHYGLDRVEQERYCNTILSRFANAALGDTVSRVSRDPMRKLSPQMYFSNPINLAIQAGVEVQYLSTVVAAALKFRSVNDAQSLQLGDMIARVGVAQTVREVCGITEARVIERIESAYKEIGD